MNISLTFGFIFADGAELITANINDEKRGSIAKSFVEMSANRDLVSAYVFVRVGEYTSEPLEIYKRV